ncbi:MAG: UDP-glucose 4-epimerase GalE [Actinomycetota bacterium]|nr:UDP-glucose 4-epimerase GalE [Actinomycetota bacterium]
MRILITGGAGYIGSCMLPMLSSAGHDVLVLDNLSRGHKEAVRAFDIEVVDLEDSQAIADICSRFKPEGCIHFAAVSLVDESMADPLKYFRVNLSGGLNLLRALVLSNCCLFVFSSTAAVYGIPQQVPISEEQECKPINPYGLSKLMFEKILLELDRAGILRFVSLRYFNAAGADLKSDLGEDHEPETHLIPNVIRAALGISNEVRIFGTDYPTKDGTCMRDYIHVKDLCRAHILGLERIASGEKSAIYNLGGGSGFSVREVIECVKRISGREFKVIEDKRRAGDPPVLVASSGKISKELGWVLEFKSLEEIVRTAWVWHSKHPDGYSRTLPGTLD